MKIKIIEFEATPEDLRASNTVAQNIIYAINEALCPSCYADDDEEEEVTE